MFGKISKVSQETRSCLGNYPKRPKVWEYPNIDFARILSVFMMIIYTKYYFNKTC